MLTIIWLLLLPTLIQAQAPIQGQPSNKDIARMLQRADSYRVPYQASRSVSVVQVFVQGVLQKTRQYHVYSRGNGDVLVIFKSKAEAGQKMLMVDHHYWLMMPKSRRPIRITPMQKLLGDASVGDLSTIVWEQSYQAQWQATEQLQNLDGVMVNTEKLQLRAKHKNVSYANITLWLDATSHFPVKADLYLTSGKLAKQVWYQASQDNSQLRVASMGFSDLLQSGKHTIINYQQVTPIKLQDKYYNPAFLSRNALSGL
ncbi:MAG: outer membrane lipoprotein-sorting protein [Gammaproteobacteria bacterium]|nr:outer membrane lipoprotein-sorting protein [Gammaproteobacteria bacterium]